MSGQASAFHWEKRGGFDPPMFSVIIGSSALFLAFPLTTVRSLGESFQGYLTAMEMEVTGAATTSGQGGPPVERGHSLIDTNLLGHPAGRDMDTQNPYRQSRIQRELTMPRLSCLSNIGRAIYKCCFIMGHSWKIDITLSR